MDAIISAASIAIRRLVIFELHSHTNSMADIRGCLSMPKLIREVVVMIVMSISASFISRFSSIRQSSITTQHDEVMNPLHASPTSAVSHTVTWEIISQKKPRVWDVKDS
jgi:hypothetical protein